MVNQELLENSSRASHLLRVLSNEKRLLILCNLLEGERCVNELQELTGLSQSAVSQQLAVLRGEQIVSVRRVAQSAFYKLTSDESVSILETLHGIYCSAPVPDQAAG